MVTIEIPDALYRRLERLAQLTQRPLNELVARALEAGMPPLPEHMPESARSGLLALERYTDDELWQVAREMLSEAQAERHAELLDRNSVGLLTEAERGELEALREAADQLLLRKAYAYVLLRWRGHKLPPLDELDADS